MKKDKVLKTQNVSNQQGSCPCCNEVLHNYEPVQFEGEYAYFPWHCDKCGTDGQEWYYLDFCGHNYYDKEGKEIILEK